MPDINRIDKDELNLSLSITIKKSDYEQKFKSELNKYQKQAHMKGFRKGKTPISVLKKMYGDGALNEVVNKVLQESLFNYLEEEKIDYLGQPILSENHPIVNIGHKSMEDYTFSFDVGQSPKVDLVGVSKSDSYSKYAVNDIPAEMIEKDFKNLRNRFGEPKEVEEDVAENDTLKLEVKALLDGEIQEDGLQSTFSVLVGEQLTEEAKEAVLGKNKGDQFRMSLLDIEKNNTEESVFRYYLEIEDEAAELPDLFELTITEIRRIELPELDEAFFQKAFGEEAGITNEEEAKANLEEDIKSYYDAQAQSFLNKDIQDILLEKNEIALPDDFLKRWIKVSNEEKSSMEEIEASYGEFQKGLKWSLISRNIQEQYNLQVGEEEIVQATMDNIRSMYGGYITDEEMIRNFAMRMLSDEKQVSRFFDQAMNKKVLEKVKEEVTILENEISVEEFDAMMEELRAKRMAEQIKNIQEETQTEAEAVEVENETTEKENQPD